jgi:transcriptional regulator of heat shock response
MSPNNVINHQQILAEELYNKDPELAMRIAMGEENAPEGIQPAAIYGKVCDEAEKTEDLEICMRIANSHHNSKISAEAQSLKFRNPDSAIEKMKEVVNARREAFERTLPKGKTYEMVVKEEVEKIKKEIEKAQPNEKDVEDFVNSLDRDLK